MDRSSPRLVLLAALVSACGSATVTGRPLASGERPQVSASGLGTPAAKERGGLVYQVALGETLRAWVQLAFDTQLHWRRNDGELQSLRLGPVDYEVTELIVDDDRSMWLSSTAGWIRKVSIENAVVESEWRAGAAVTALHLSEDRKYLLYGTDTGVLCLRRADDGALLQCMQATDARVSALDSTGTTLALGTWSGELQLFDLPSLRRRHRHRGEGSLTALSFSPEGEWLALARSARPERRTPELAKREKNSAALDPLGKNRIELWSVSKGSWSQRHELRGHRNLISDLAWLGADLLSCSWDRSLRLWSFTKDGAQQRDHWTTEVRHQLSDLATRPEGARFLVGGWSRSLEDATLWSGALLYAPRSDARKAASD